VVAASVLNCARCSRAVDMPEGDPATMNRVPRDFATARSCAPPKISGTGVQFIASGGAVTSSHGACECCHLVGLAMRSSRQASTARANEICQSAAFTLEDRATKRQPRTIREFGTNFFLLMSGAGGSSDSEGGREVAEPEPSDGARLARQAFDALRRFDSAVEKLAGYYRERVRRYCARILESDDDAEDASQEALRRVVKSLSTLSAPEAFERWLFRIAVNCCKDIATKRGRLVTNQEGGPDGPLANLPDPSDPIAEMHDAAAANEAICAARDAVAARDDLDQSIFRLLYVEGVGNIAEISRTLGRPENTIRSRVERLRAMLAEIGRKVNSSG
jgi:RNA polymerase sigma-70 factor, ECF subfamily